MPSLTISVPFVTPPAVPTSARTVCSLPPRSSVPPVTRTTPFVGSTPGNSPPASRSVPAATSVAQAYVFVPESVSVLEPDFLKAGAVSQSAAA